MSSTNHYRDQIQRATHRLAQLQARELLAHQRQDAREKAIKRRDDAKRRRQVAELVFLAGAQNLPDNEIVAALQRHMLAVNETRLSLSLMARSAPTNLSTFHAKSKAGRI